MINYRKRVKITWFFLFIIFILFLSQVRSNFVYVFVKGRCPPPVAKMLETYLLKELFFSKVTGWCNFTENNFFTGNSVTSKKQEVLYKNICFAKKLFCSVVVLQLW